ncbi:phosphoglycerate mutase-like protein [Durotheca rogersii]|uniref:phosphoglycerate mutase-like protein n=1 Tax=Durotheca rogersii TaxID=419775 RepID=UPI0022204DDA|nr:phosphoglycerate mutase-like protein [Durotheca rogersii]KAI5866129.1 phosphoglycerate mutase-like protein [Durotheca rogersii]
MLAISVFALLSLGSPCLAWEWGKSGKWNHKQRTTCHGGESTIEYTTISGFFQQDDPSTDSSSFDYAEVNYGLIERPYLTDNEFDPKGEKTQWERFAYYVNTLNLESDKNTQYKVLFMARHGEGYHNAAESYYGTPAWNCYWGPLEGNGTSVWRDALLTEAGFAQCTKANNFWKNALAVEKIPAPQAYYSSPLIRSATTANLTFNGLDLPADRPFVPIVKEFLREGISMRTCDLRSNKTYIQSLLPAFTFEEGFTENDELWRGYEGETSEAQRKRTKIFLDDVFSNDDSTWVSITSHSGQIRENLRILNHIEFRLSTGQAIPALIKAVNNRRVEPVTTTIQSFVPEATCSSPPITSISGQGCVCSSAASTAVFASATPTATPA